MEKLLPLRFINRYKKNHGYRKKNVMIKHIVVWKLQESAEGKSKTENAMHMKILLENMRGKIPGLKHLEVGLNTTGEQSDADIVLYAEFETRADLVAYQIHPVHVAAGTFISKVRAERYVVDYDV
jgi:hypothetical protein